ncbi:hypothetical protein LB506_011990 [Fusarium annulatum]|nr:hypothetical protein LB506_011990 [Fusarium annulatum]
MADTSIEQPLGAEQSYTATSALPARMQTEAGFYKTFIVEVVINGVYDQASNSNKIKKPNWPRGNFEYLRSPLRDVLGAFSSTSVFYNDTEDTSGNTYIDSPSPFVHNDGQSTYMWYKETDQNAYLAFNIKSHKPAWSSFVKQIVGAGLGLIPILGPLLALNWDIIYSYLDDPAGFAEYAHIGKEWLSILKLQAAELKKAIK